MKIMSLPLVSIVVTTKNEADNIDYCLKSIKQQTYPQKKIEVIVVDNNSIDQTKQIAKKYTQKVFNKSPERSAQRNFGMLKKSHGKYVMFLDADMTLSEKLIEFTVAELENNNFVGFYISEKVTGNSFWDKIRNFERSFYDGTVIDCARIIRKDIFVKTGGFDESLTGPEDWDLDKRIRFLGKVGLLEKNKGLIYHCERDFSLDKYLAKKSYYAQSFTKYISKWGEDDQDIKKQFGFWYRYFAVFIEKGKWKRLIKYPFLTIAMYLLKILIGFNYLCKDK